MTFQLKSVQKFLHEEEIAVISMLLPATLAYYHGDLIYYLVFEFAFFIYMYMVAYRHLPTAVVPKNFPAFDDKILSQLWKEVGLIKDFKKYISGWFMECDFAEIKRGNLLQLFAGAFYNKRIELSFHNDHLYSNVNELEDDEYQLINDVIDRVQTIHNVEFPPGFNENCKCMRLTLDPITYYHRPFVFYLGVFISDIISFLVLKAMGFQRKRHGKHGYWIRRVPSSLTTITFFHGIGIGYGPYLYFIRNLSKSFNRTILLVDKPAVSMRLSHKFYLPHEMADKVASIFKTEDIKESILVGHSLGSQIVSWVNKFHPKSVKKSILIDSTCFCLWTHQVAYSFLYKPLDGIQRLIQCISSTEYSTAHFLHRYMVWYDGGFFTDEIPRNCEVFLSADDDIVDSKYTSEYLNKHGPKQLLTTIFPNTSHGGFLFSSSRISQIIDGINRK
jgi:pimeloyl-ACP methyl ester carboxylesterase